MLPKLIYFAHRHPDFDAEAFRKRWRQHGQLGMSLPRWRNVARYAQCDAVAALPDSPRRWPCDGVATVMFRSEANRLAHIADPEGRITKADEKETFAKPVSEEAVLTTEMPVTPHRDCPDKIFLIVRRHARVTTDAFEHWWKNEYAQRFLNRCGANAGHFGYSQNHARRDVGGRFDADCVDEISSSRPQTIISAVEQLIRTDNDFGEYVRELRWVATHETVLFPESEN